MVESWSDAARFMQVTSYTAREFAFPVKCMTTEHLFEKFELR